MKFREFADMYMERHAKPKKGTWKLDQGRLNKYILPGEYEGLPGFADLDLEEITPDHIGLLHSRIGMSYPIQANRVKEQLSKMFNLAITWKKLPWNHPNPTIGVEDFDEISRARFASESEAGRIIRELKRVDSVYVRGAILLLLMTGLRKTEVLKMEWQKIDWDTKEIRVINIKTKEVTYQPLSAAAIEVISMTPRIGNNPYIIVGKLPGRHRATIDKVWQRIRKRAGVEDIRLHDLKRTVGSWLSQNGVNIQIVKEVMNHKDIKTTMIYARVGSKQKREALEIQGKLMSKLIAG